MMKSSLWNARWLLVIGACFFLAGCVTGGKGQINTSLLSFFNNYDMALKDYQAGKIMEARARVLAIDAGRVDYKKAQILLQKKIDPARIRLLRHYKTSGKKAEKNKEWSKAMAFYQQAGEFSTEPDAFLANVNEMELKMRQKRMDILLKQKRLEDDVWIGWSRSYEAPHGVDAKDVAFLHGRESIESLIEDRADRSYREARRYLNKDMVGVAYVEAESYLRLMPGSEKGQHLMEDVRKDMPKKLIVRVLGKNEPVKQVRKKRVQKERPISKSDVTRLMKKGDWKEAKNAALLYRRHQGEGADKLLKEVDVGIKKTAAILFEQGSSAFRREHIDEAVKLWSEAVSIQPENSEYVEALRRATQLQERLNLLRNDGK